MERDEAQDLDTLIDALEGAGATRWASQGIAGRLAVLERLQGCVQATAADWVAAAATAKGVEADSPAAAEEWINGPVVVMRAVKAWEHSLRQIAEHGRVVPPAVHRRADGQTFVTTLPVHTADKVLFPGFGAQSWMQPDVDDTEVGDASAGYIDQAGSVHAPAVVLGAGNVASVGVVDAFDQLFGRHRPVLLKLSEAMASMTEVITAALAPLVELDVLRIVAGGPRLGERLVDHPAFGAVHVTGAEATRDAVVARVASRSADTDGRHAPGGPRVTAEVGGLTPVIVVPGPWRPGDYAWQGTNIAAMLVGNAGFNCVTSRVLIQHRSWTGRRRLTEAIQASVAKAEPRPAFHPGASERWSAAVEGRPFTHLGHAPDDGVLGYGILQDVEPDDAWLTSDPFCGLMADVGLAVPQSVPDYLDAAVELCNEHVYGSLAAVIIVHPRSLVDAAIGAALDRAVENLRYGTVMINHFPGVAFATMTTPWGSAAGDGWAHETMMLERVAKTVVWGPFRPRVTPPWIHEHRRLASIGPRLVHFLATGEARMLPALALDTLRA